MTVVNPVPASRRAIAKPMPESLPAPVTMATPVSGLDFVSDAGMPDLWVADHRSPGS